MSSKHRLLICPTLMVLACNRYEWKPDSCRRSQSPTPKPIRIEREISGLGGGIRGHVATADDTGALVGAHVDLAQRPGLLVSTDSKGYFAFDSVPPGRYFLRIRAIGFSAWKDTVSVVSSARPEFDVTVAPDTLDGECGGFMMVRVKKPWWKFW